ncbi:PIG-L deacetylase family protein [Paracoccus sp. 22332]|uniref:PIG-L deacetylase family protein n=1 Tax=Paracoccus sp. 22332 TaxID=3453913 RepID=UPI003F8542F3
MSGFLDNLGPPIGVADLLGGRPLAVLAPHPDDETLGCGALLFDAAAHGARCTVICVTDGSRSHPKSRGWPPRRLAEQRRAELEAAAAILGATTHWLGHGDCRVRTDADISDLIPQGALLLATWEGDPHVDHQSVARMARTLARRDVALAYYPIWGRFTDRTAPTRTIAASAAALTAKRRALACHRSQMTPLIDDDPEGFVMEPWRQEHFLTHPEIVIAP